MKTTKQIFNITFAFIIALVSQTKAQTVRTPGDFTSLRVGGIIDVVLTQSDSNSIRITGTEEQAAKIITEVVDGVLKISQDGKFSGNDIKIYVNMKEIKNINVVGAADVKGKEQITADKISLNASGAGNINLKIKSNEVVAEINGAGNITLDGTTDSINARISGAGDLKAFNLEAQKATVKVSGSGDAKVTAKEKIKASVSGAGDIVYKGDPADREVEISGAGSVRQSNESGTVEVGMSNDSRSSGDTTRLKLKNKKLIIIDENDSLKTERKKIKGAGKVKDIWSGFEMGINGYLNSANSTSLSPGYNFLELDYRKCINVNVNLFEKHIKIYKNHIALTTGLGFEFNKYAFQNDYTLPTDPTMLPGFNPVIDFKKNALKANYITVPLLLELNTHAKHKKSFHLAGGIVGGYNYSTFLKQEFELDGVTHKLKSHDDFSVNPFKASATVRLGYGNFTLYANYGLTELFKKGPVLYPFSIGVRLIGF